MSADIQLRAITSADLDDWHRMRAAIYPLQPEEDHHQEMRQVLDHPDWWCWFVVSGETRIGLVEMSSRNIVDACLSSPVAYLEGFYLEPPCRNAGIGGRLIERLKQWAREQGFSELATDTELGNTGAQRFYKKHGFSESDRVVAYRMAL